METEKFSARASRILAEECEAAGVPAMTLHDVADEVFAELDTRCLDDVPTRRLVTLRVAGLVIRELTKHQGNQAEETSPLVRCPQCGNTDEFAGYLAVSVDVNRKDGSGRYITTWSEGLDFEVRCAWCGTSLDGEISDQLYENMEINL